MFIHLLCLEGGLVHCPVSVLKGVGTLPCVCPEGGLVHCPVSVLKGVGTLPCVCPEGGWYIALCLS